MICTTIQNKDLEAILEALDSPQVEMAEIRLDRCPLSLEDIDELFSNCDTPLVATCRVSELMEQLREGTPENKLESRAAQLAETKLLRAVRAGAAYVDVEIEAPAMMAKRVRREAQNYGTLLVRSYHDFKGTESAEALKALTEKCFHLGADVAKIVTTALSDGDVQRVESLYADFEPARLVAFCMGEAGRQSRLSCLAKGAPYTYAALSETEAAAPGQWPVKELYSAVYFSGNARMSSSDAPIPMPSSKSFAQRAIIIAALAEGVSHLRGYSPCGDNESAISVARALGAEVTVGLSYQDGILRKDASTLTIKGIGAGPGSSTCPELHTGESGFLARMMIPILACIASGPVHITGEGTLVSRPLKGAKQMLGAFGTRVEGDAQGEEVHVPLSVSGPLRSGKAEISGRDGSQLVSGLLTALALTEGDTEIHLQEPKSIPYIFITVDVLKKFGIIVENEMEGGEAFLESGDWDLCDGISFRIRGGQRFRACDIDIEADWSSAANFLVAGAVFGKTALSGLDTSSLQADLSIMDILSQAGASLSQEEENGVLHVQKAPLSAIKTNASNCPDLFPIISVLAAFCEGRSVIGGVGRLATKESDRGHAIVSMLTQMGVRASVRGDELVIFGKSLSHRLLTNTLLRGGQYTSHHDHRMVMALMVASLGADSPIVIDDTACVRKSFPTFMELFNRL